MANNLKESLEVVTTDGRKLTLDVSDEACIKLGFKHGDIAMNQNDNKVEILGVALDDYRGVDVLWYTIIHPAIKGQVCCWGGKPNLLEAGFYLYEELV